jgi:hypothetical protein
MDTTAPGEVTCLRAMAFVGVFVLQARLVAFPYMHAAHFGMGHVASHIGRSPLAAICLIFANGM